MNIIKDIQAPGFWKKFALIAIPFFVVLVIISLIMSNAKAFFSFDFGVISELNFSEGKWKQFFAIKIVISVLYGFIVALKKRK